MLNINLDDFLKLRNKKIIINADHDGMECGLILHKFYGCEVVGWSDSKKTVILDKNYNLLKDAIYIDMFVDDNETLCIDQHAVALNQKHKDYLNSFQTKINFNLICDEPHFPFTNTYRTKYPLSTTETILTMALKNGKDIEFPNLYQPIKDSNFLFGDVRCRTDDIFEITTVAYRDNACDWWRKTNKLVGCQGCLWDVERFIGRRERDLGLQIGKFIDSVTSSTINIKSNEEIVGEYKSSIDEYFVKNFGTDKKGGYKDIAKYIHGTYISPNFREYVKFYCDIFGVDVDEFLGHHDYDVYVGEYVYGKDLPLETIEETIYNETFFSHAFTGYNKFSYTVNMKKN